MTEKYNEALARSMMYELLSLAFLHPEEGRAAAVSEGALKVAAVASGIGWHGIESRLRDVSSKLVSVRDEALRDEYIQIFGHTISKDCPPYEGEYGQAHIFQKSQTLAELSAFYNAFGVTISPMLKDRPDHISVELEFMHLLTSKEAYGRLHGHGEEKVLICRQGQRNFLESHLAGWVKGCARKLGEKAGNGAVYASLAGLLEMYMDAEFQSFRLNAEPSGVVTVSPEAEDEVGCEVSPLSFNTAQEGALP